MSIEKSLYSAPQGIDELMDDIENEEPEIEIEIEDPESVDMHLPGLEIEIEPDEEEDFNENLAEMLSAAELQQISSELISDFDDDVSSRRDWMQTYVDGIELLGMKLEDRAEPWEGACGVYHPMLSEALVKFQAESITSTFPAAGPVKTKIIGKETFDKREASIRVQDDMNHMLTDVMVEFRPEQERMFWGLGMAGNAFKKVYYDPGMERPVSVFVPAEDMVVPYGASNLETAERVTHVMRKTENELRKLQVSGFYRDIDLGQPDNTLDEVEKKIAEKMGFRATSDSRYKLLEMHVDLDIPGYEDLGEDGEPTGIALPYVVTLEKGSGEVLSIRRNWDPEDETKQKRNHFVHYGYVPGFGFYCLGLIHLVGAFAKSGTSIIRQLVDAGTLSNLPGGFKTRGLRIKGDDTPIAPGEFRDVDVPSGAMRDNVMPLPYKEPSQVLYSLLNTIVEEGRRFASAADLKIADMSANTPVGTTLAVLERTLKVMSAVQARIHYSLKQELCLLRDIIRDYTPEEYTYEPVEGSPRAKQSDYDCCEVIPVSDPNAATMSQKVVQYQAVLQLAQSAPQIYNLPELHRQMLDVLGIQNAQKLVPLEDDERPKDPMTENMNILKMKPVKAFIDQDQQAHIMAHTAFMQDPLIQQSVGQNPQATAMQAAMQAHIAEHIGFAYRAQLEQMLGMPLPTPDSEEELPMSVQNQIAAMVAQATQTMAAQHAQEQQAQQAQQQAQDPLIQLQQQELQIKAQDIQRKAQKDQVDAQLKMQQQQIERERINAQATAEAQRLQAKIRADDLDMEAEGMKFAAQRQSDRDRLEAEGMKFEADRIAKMRSGK